MNRPILVAFLVVCLFPVITSAPSVKAGLLDEAGVKGGLVVHLGCADGSMTVSLRVDNRYLVHALDAEERNVDATRVAIRQQGCAKEIHADRVIGARLPYADGIVNAMVVSDPRGVSDEEILRVMAPDGVILRASTVGWSKTVKPRPDEIDEWTHFLHNPTNNAVGKDAVVGPPGQVRWIGSPEYCRSHDHLSSVSAAVVAGGRLFYIVDEAPIAAAILQPRWKLVACDAFSGVVLWKRKIDLWQWHLRGFRTGPSDLARRLVARGDRVFVTLGIDSPLSVLDAATGETVRTYESTEGTREVLLDGDTLYVVAADHDAEESLEMATRRGQRPGFAPVKSQKPDYEQPAPAKRLLVFDAASGEQLWKKNDAEISGLLPTTLAVADGKVFYQNTDHLVCMSATDGRRLWQARRTTSRNRPTWSAPTLVVHDGVVLSADRAVAPHPAGDDAQRDVRWFVSSAGGIAPVGELLAFSADDGKELWRCPAKECYNAPIDVFVADGVVWTGNLVTQRDPGITEGRDLYTGEVIRTRPRDQETFDCGMSHHRCYRNKATTKYLVLGRSGIEFLDVKTGEIVPNHWLRGACQYGVIPCNGLVYAPPHSCACFIAAKMTGFNCLAPKSDATKVVVDSTDRLEKGPAFDDPALDQLRQASDLSQWSTYRGDNARRGYIDAALPTNDLTTAWKAQHEGPLSAPTVAGGRVYVAAIEHGTIHAMDRNSGRELWKFTAGSRVDSPPTISQERVLFGSADGYVYCLRASDGALAWRFRAAPMDRRIVVRGKLESLWPVPGSVLVREGKVWCAAGRSSYLEGGVRLLAIDVKTGEKAVETVIDDRDPATGFMNGRVQGFNMPGALNDVLSSSGDSIFIRQRRYSTSGEQLPGDVAHLYSAAGFLDSTWWHRTYWQFATSMSSGYGGWPQTGMRVPAGRLLAMDDERIYGFGRNQYINSGAHPNIDLATIYHHRDPNKGRDTWYRAFSMDLPSATGSDARRGSGGKEFHWDTQLPVLARAILLSEEALYLVGPPNLFISQTPVEDPAAVLEGDGPAVLCVLSAKDGQVLATLHSWSQPVHDGLAADEGALYMSTTDGSVICVR